MSLFVIRIFWVEVGLVFDGDDVEEIFVLVIVRIFKKVYVIEYESI